MAELVLGIGTSHSPLLTFDAELWADRGADDMRNPALTLSDGRTMDYDTLLAERGPAFANDATPAQLGEQSRKSEEALVRLAKAIDDAEPDVVIIIGDDQDELYKLGNIPSLAVFCGDEIVMRPLGEIIKEPPNWLERAVHGYAMDTAHRFPGAPEFALRLIEGLKPEEIDRRDGNKAAGWGDTQIFAKMGARGQGAADYHIGFSEEQFDGHVRIRKCAAERVHRIDGRRAARHGSMEVAQAVRCERFPKNVFAPLAPAFDKIAADDFLIFGDVGIGHQISPGFGGPDKQGAGKKTFPWWNQYVADGHARQCPSRGMKPDEEGTANTPTDIARPSARLSCKRPEPGSRFVGMTKRARRSGATGSIPWPCASWGYQPSEFGRSPDGASEVLAHATDNETAEAIPGFFRVRFMRRLLTQEQQREALVGAGSPYQAAPQTGQRFGKPVRKTRSGHPPVQSIAGRRTLRVACMTLAADERRLLEVVAAFWRRKFFPARRERENASISAALFAGYLNRLSMALTGPHRVVRVDC